MKKLRMPRWVTSRADCLVASLYSSNRTSRWTMPSKKESATNARSMARKIMRATPIKVTARGPRRGRTRSAHQVAAKARATPAVARADRTEARKRAARPSATRRKAESFSANPKGMVRPATDQPLSAARAAAQGNAGTHIAGDPCAPRSPCAFTKNLRSPSGTLCGHGAGGVTGPQGPRGGRGGGPRRAKPRGDPHVRGGQRDSTWLPWRPPRERAESRQGFQDLAQVSGVTSPGRLPVRQDQLHLMAAPNPVGRQGGRQGDVSLHR